MELYHNAKDINKWIYSEDSCEDCCNEEFFLSIANDAGQLDTSRANDRYYLEGSFYYICGICMDDCCLEELANEIKNNYDEFYKLYGE